MLLRPSAPALRLPLLTHLRATGADRPWGDPLGAHPGIGVEGWFWRVSDPVTGRVVVVVLGVTQPADGPAWAMVALGVAPGEEVRVADGPVRRMATSGIALEVGDGLLVADADGVAVDLGSDARAELRWSEAARWPVGRWGGVGPAHVVPGLSQYWHPWLLGGTASGSVVLGADAFELSAARVYGEKNWGGGGMPEQWWWGQANAFADADACVAFAGGTAGLGRLQVPAGALVLRLGGELHHVVGPPLPLGIRTSSDTRWSLRGRTLRGDVVSVEGTADPATAAPHWLPVPVPGTREHRAGHSPQHLTGEVQVEVRRRGRVRWSGTSPLAGLERGRGLPSRG